MLSLIVSWTLLIAAEAGVSILHRSLLLRRPAARLTVYAVLGVVELLVIFRAMSLDGRIFWLAAGLGMYRLCMLGRGVVSRVQPEYLRTANLRANIWLASMQLISSGVLWLIWDTITIRLMEPRVTLLALALVQCAVAVALLRITVRTWNFTRTDDMGSRHASSTALPAISVLIAAKNERESLRQCLSSIITSDYPDFEVLVLADGRSETAQAAQDYKKDHVRLVRSKQVPASWLPRNYAYEQLRQAAQGEVLLFCTADTVFEPQTLRALVNLLSKSSSDMLSVLPQHIPGIYKRFSLLQPMRYYWEISFPRRLFKRPPVINNCWLIKASRLAELEGFVPVKNAVTPEAYFAKRTIVNNAYRFIRSSEHMPLYSSKAPHEYSEGVVRVRYPQLHRRIEIVAIVSLFQFAFLLGPFICLGLAGLFHVTLLPILLWVIAALSIMGMYYLVAVRSGLNGQLAGGFAAPFAIIADLVMIHWSMLRYEFGSIRWKGQDIVPTVMRLNR